MKKASLYARYTLITVLVFTLFFAMGSAISAYVNNNNVADPVEENEPEVIAKQDGKRTNILILGVDARPGESSSRSDTMLLASIDPGLDQAVIVSIPRDTKVEVPGSPLDKICTANFVGGPEYAVEIVEKLLAINIDYYVEADFNGFKKVIDKIGGVTINVPQRMYKPSENIDLYPGTKKLNGYEALAYVRYRDYLFGDIDRTTHQQEFLVALADELLQPKTIPKLPGLIKETRNFVNTNMGIKDLIKIASWAPGFTSSSIITQTLPGYFYDVYNEEGVMEQSYWIADKGEMADILDQLFAGKSVAVMQNSPIAPYVPPTKVEKPSSEEEQEETASDIDGQRDEERSHLPSPGLDQDSSYDDPDWNDEGDRNDEDELNNEDELSDEGDWNYEDELDYEEEHKRQGHWEEEEWEQRQDEESENSSPYSEI